MAEFNECFPEHVIEAVDDIVGSVSDCPYNVEVARRMGRVYLPLVVSFMNSALNTEATYLDKVTKKEVAVAKSFFLCVGTPNLEDEVKNELAEIWGRFTDRYGERVVNVPSRTQYDTCPYRAEIVFEKI